jgi:hypothetical protein
VNPTKKIVCTLQTALIIRGQNMRKLALTALLTREKYGEKPFIENNMEIITFIFRLFTFHITTKHFFSSLIFLTYFGAALKIF